MTEALLCDHCGYMVTGRSESDEPTKHWFRVEATPSFVPGLLQPIKLDVLENDAGYRMESVEPEPDELEDVPPDWHFCSRTCLASWAADIHQA